jgi:hypothetical protein
MCLLSACGPDEFRRQEDRLKSLVQQRASKQEAIQLLGSDFIAYSQGKTNWEYLTEILTREPQRYGEVRQGAKKWPNVLFYSTPDMTTWVFLDKDEKVVGFVVGTQ